MWIRAAIYNFQRQCCIPEATHKFQTLMHSIGHTTILQGAYFKIPNLDLPTVKSKLFTISKNTKKSYHWNLHLTNLKLLKYRQLETFFPTWSFVFDFPSLMNFKAIWQLQWSVNISLKAHHWNENISLTKLQLYHALFVVLWSFMLDMNIIEVNEMQGNHAIQRKCPNGEVG